MFLWIWGLLGVSLITTALFTNLIDFLIPGLAALVLAALNLLPVFNTALPLQFGVWVLVSALGVVVFRRKFGGLFNTGQPSSAEKEVLGKKAVVLEALTESQSGRVRFEGTTWTARAQEAIEAGREVVVLGREGLTLLVALSEDDRINEAFKALEEPKQS